MIWRSLRKRLLMHEADELLVDLVGEVNQDKAYYLKVEIDHQCRSIIGAYCASTGWDEIKLILERELSKILPEYGAKPDKDFIVFQYNKAGKRSPENILCTVIVLWPSADMKQKIETYVELTRTPVIELMR